MRDVVSSCGTNCKMEVRLLIVRILDGNMLPHAVYDMMSGKIQMSLELEHHDLET